MRYLLVTLPLLTLAACAVPANDDASTAASELTGGACTSDADCGGRSAVCLVDRCAKVLESSISTATPTTSQLTGDAQAAYTPDGELHVAYEGWGRGIGYSFFEGAFPTLQKGGGVYQQSNPFAFDHAPGLAPMIAGSYSAYGAGGIGFGDQGGLRIGNHDRVDRFAVGRNGSGDMFIVAAVMSRSLAGPGNGAHCDLRFASKPRGGRWSYGESVAPCHDSFHDLGIHVRSDGGADVIAAPSWGDLVVYRQASGWAKTVLVSGDPQKTKPAFVMSHGKDGTSHLVAEPFGFGYDLSRGDYSARYMELGDDAVVRTVPLSDEAMQWLPPYRTVDVDGRGNVWIEKRTSAMVDRSSVVRIDPEGRLALRDLGRIATGTQQRSTIAVSPSGELALVHHAGGRSVNVRRFVPLP